MVDYSDEIEVMIEGTPEWVILLKQRLKGIKNPALAEISQILLGFSKHE